MLSKLRTKVRSLAMDLATNDFQIFTYTNSAIFTLAEPNVSSVTNVLVNGNTLQSGESSSFDSATNKVTISGVSFSTNDSIEIDFVYTQFSDTELDEYIRAALVWTSVFGNCETDYELEDSIYPSPDNRTLDLIAVIASILINPDYTEYRLPDLVVKYPKAMPKETKIEKLLEKFNWGIGAVGVLEINVI